MDNCKNCGAPIDHSQVKCTYCGTYYSKHMDESYVTLYADNIPVEKEKRNEKI